MLTPRNALRISALIVGLTTLLQTAPASAQTYYYNVNPWFWVTSHNFTFVSVSAPREYKQATLFGGSFVYGIVFEGTTASGQTRTVQIMAPNVGGIIGPRIGYNEFEMMYSVVQAFHDNPQHYSTLKFFNLQKRFYTPYTVIPGSKLVISVSDPAAPTDSDLNGGLVELVVNASGDFYAEAKIRRTRSCGSSFRQSRIGVLRNDKAFILNRQTWFSTLRAASPAMAFLFVDTAVDGVPFLDVSGTTKLEDNDPYHLTGGACVRSTYIIDDYRWIQING